MNRPSARDYNECSFGEPSNRQWSTFVDCTCQLRLRGTVGDTQQMEVRFFDSFGNQLGETTTHLLMPGGTIAVTSIKVKVNVSLD